MMCPSLLRFDLGVFVIVEKNLLFSANNSLSSFVDWCCSEHSLALFCGLGDVENPAVRLSSFDERMGPEVLRRLA